MVVVVCVCMCVLVLVFVAVGGTSMYVHYMYVQEHVREISWQDGVTFIIRSYQLL